MAIERERPYSAFNYHVNLNGGDGPETKRAGFQEVSGLSVEITMQEYRAGNDVRKSTQKIPGVYSVPDVTFKRGLLGATDLTEWLQEVRDGIDARRQVVVQLKDEQHGEPPAMTWILEGAQPLKYTGPTLSGASTEVAVEELVLSVEDIKIE